MVMAAGIAERPTHAAVSFTVNSTGDAADENPGTGTCQTATPGECTLRAAIEEANANNNDPTVDVINFAIPGAGPHTISPSSSLPDITDPVTIDGYTQGDSTPTTDDDATENTLAVGNNAVLKIELSGPGAQSGVSGLKIKAADSTVRGLVISNWDNAIFLTVDALNIGATGNKVQGNYIGTDASGTTGLGNNIGVALTNALNNTIGGTTAAARNIISDNGAGILISGGTGNKVQSNYIGTDVTGTATDPDGIPNNGDELGNLLNGVSIETGAANNTIGGTTAAAGNVISGNGNNSGSDTTNTKSGVEVQFANSDTLNKATGNRILSNSIYDNARLGIDLYSTNDPPGVTDNDVAPLDTDDGPNHLQNFPVITPPSSQPGE